MRPIQDAFPLLQTPKKIFITTHHKPDGDALGSMLGLALYLRKKGHTVTPVSPNEVPGFLAWMPGIDSLMSWEAESKKAQQALNDADLIFCVDFNNFSRTKFIEQALGEASQPKILIDHHLVPAPVWDYGMSIPEKSSTCEMVYDFINLCNDNELIDTEIAECLYTGVMTDTGSFRFPITTATVHEMIADLKHKGLDHSKVHDLVYDSWPAMRMRFVGYMLLEKMELFPEYNASLMTLSRKEMMRFDLQAGDTEGIVNLPMSIANIQFATLILERGDEVKFSFRSKGNFDVSSFAREHFNGGGHFNASGGSLKMPLNEAVAYFKEILSDIHPS